MTENDIKGNFAAIRELADAVVGADMPEGERAAVKTLTTCSLLLLEGFFLDINRAANSLEWMAQSAADEARRG